MKQLIKKNQKTILVIVLAFFFLSTCILFFNNSKLEEEKERNNYLIISNLKDFEKVVQKLLNLQQSIVSESDPVKLEELLRTWEYAGDTFIDTLGMSGGVFLKDELMREYSTIHGNFLTNAQSFTTATTQQEREKVMNNIQTTVKRLEQFRNKLIKELDVNLEEEI